MVKYLIAIAILFGATTYAYRLPNNWFQCPAVTFADSFSIKRYLGLWYQAEANPFIFTLNGKCINVDYVINPSGKLTAINGEYINSKLVQSIYELTDSDTPGKFSINTGLGNEAPYWIIGTDYDNYAVVYACENGFPNYGIPNVWILTRDREPNQATINKAYAVLDANHLSKTGLQKMKQVNCPMT